MNTLTKVLLLEFWFFILFPVVGSVLIFAFGVAGLFLYVILFVIWCWELFAFSRYRYCRQEEFLHVLQTAAATGAPVESVLQAYLKDRPQEQLLRPILLSFVFPGYFLIHRQRSFDARLQRVLALLKSGVSLDRALGQVPGVVSRQTALAVAVGQFSGTLRQSLGRLSEQRTAPMWLEWAPRLMYPLLILSTLIANVAFLVTFIVPKFEKIFADFKMKLPMATQSLVDASRSVPHLYFDLTTAWFLFLIALNILAFSSHAKWYCPVVGWVYRLYVRGQFLQMLGLMLETRKPLPEILDRAIESGQLPRVLETRVDGLKDDLSQGRPLAESMARHELVTAPMAGLIAAAENAQNLPWALRELGDTLARRGTRISLRIAMVLFPVTIVGCACLVAFVAVSMFEPLIALMEGLPTIK
jgi:type IV pilus assembly protein PilC